ncbi:uncharacterized protein LOC123704873 [Colias croceus]|uniref:uncharacterized protein LOC123704873 n=1 Tax=Colias crocea TaxID=72248 RepID=UPI001E27D2B7|nr:uncharacterized protein LOC123704873 [Colias croceus]
MTPEASRSRLHVPRSKPLRQQQENMNTLVSLPCDPSEILLATAIIKVQAADGSYLNMRALLDQGSQISIISENAAQLLKVPRQKCDGYISGIGNKANNCKGKITMNCMSNINNFTFETDAFIMKKLVRNLPNHTIPKPDWPMLDQIKLADSEFYKSRPIDILLGADVYSEILMDGICRSNAMFPVAQQTQLGWILSGNCKSEYQCNLVLNSDIQQFWEMEDVPEPLYVSQEDQNCIDFYQNTTERRDDGCYVVKIPLKENFEEKLGESKSKCIAQYMQLENKLIKQSHLAREYKLFISEYKELGHMIPCMSDADLRPSCYLPHHCVLRAESSTTKLRVVFNASSKTLSGFSLNDLMYRGPNLQQDLQILILRWRLFKYGFTADIEKMFRNIWLHDEHQKLQKIIWRDHKSQPLQEFQLATVTYGTKSAPFLAMMTLKKLANDERSNYPNSIAPHVLENSFYMDDLLHGSHTVEEAKRLKLDLISLLKAGGFNLRKWRSNLLDLSDDMDDIEKAEFDFKHLESTKMLGLRWDPNEDQFIFYPIEFISNPIPTKRQFLSEISKIFDPLGWLAPVTIKLKILFQETWKSDLRWDQPVTPEIASEWNRIKDDIPHIKKFKIPRWIQTQDKDIIELHGFCDASTKAYACVVYCKIKRYNTTHVTLVAAKSKVVPLKKALSIPRLELCGALLLSKLMKSIVECVPNFTVRVYGWVDSTAVLGWINGEPDKWKPFVANRVKMICETIPKNQWQYVNTTENPADCASRGSTALNLANSSYWWNGPKWLPQYNPKEHTENPTYTTNEDLKKNITCVNAATTRSDYIIKQLLSKYSSLRKIIRILAYIVKFIDKIIYKKTYEYNYLTMKDLKRAREMIIRHVQDEYFFQEKSQLSNGLPLSKKSTILSLNPVLDSTGLLRVGGRLKNSNINPEMKYPIIIPPQSKLAELIIDESHELVFHGGPKLTAGFIRQKYWILRGNRAVKKRLRLCVKCKKVDPTLQHQLMGDLPPSRVIPSRPFYNTGIDFTGHVLVKANKGRGIKTSKGYIAVFILCMVTKAVHLELVSDLTASAFIAALRRMSARRGVPRHIYSDQGTNFIGANNILQREYTQILEILSSNECTSIISEMNIDWHFNAPSWPSAGGLWEAAVKSLKHHLKRVIGEQKLAFEEYSTLLSQLEACLNSRPLCPLTEDPDNLDYLTPAHFLASGPNLTIFDTENDLRTRWHLTQKIYQDVWVKWKNEYLTQLSIRSKWKQPQTDLKLNDIVIIKDENLPPGKWALGRVVQLHPGSDGLVRVVTLKTKNGYMKRPIVKLSLLPTNTHTINESTDYDKEEIKISKTKNPRGMSFSAIVLSLTLFFLSIISSCHAQFTYTPLNNNSIYFDKLTNMRLVGDDWKLIVYYDKYPYQEGTAALVKDIQYLKTICPMIREQLTQCDAILLQLEHEFGELEYYNNILFMSDSFDMGAKRPRRGLIDGVGYVANNQDLNTNSSEDIKQFDEIKRKIDLLKLSEPLGTKLSYHDIHHYFIIYVLIGILVVVAIITYWRQLRRRRASAEPAVEAATNVAVPARPPPTPVTSDCVISVSECDVRVNKHDQASSPIFRVFSLPNLSESL